MHVRSFTFSLSKTTDPEIGGSLLNGLYLDSAHKTTTAWVCARTVRRASCSQKQKRWNTLKATARRKPNTPGCFTERTWSGGSRHTNTMIKGTEKTKLWIQSPWCCIQHWCKTWKYWSASAAMKLEALVMHLYPVCIMPLKTVCIPNQLYMYLCLNKASWTWIHPTAFENFFQIWPYKGNVHSSGSQQRNKPQTANYGNVIGSRHPTVPTINNIKKHKILKYVITKKISLPPVAGYLNSKVALAMRPSCSLSAPTSLAGQQSHSCRQSEGHMVCTMRWEFDLYTQHGRLTALRACT